MSTTLGLIYTSGGHLAGASTTTNLPSDPALQTSSLKPKTAQSYQTTTMSAPNPGRQSPPPSAQDPSQVSAPESGKAGAAPSDDHAKDVSEKAKSDDSGVLSSNPEGPLEGAAHEKVSKEGRGGAEGLGN
ncbi:MAG: hypothetical protein Q9169_007438 [Polycauliona sp. 2 TL-2023]